MRLEPLLKCEGHYGLRGHWGWQDAGNESGWDDAKIILADQSLEVTGMGNTLVAARVQRDLEFLNVELNGLAAAGYGPETK